MAVIRGEVAASMLPDAIVLDLGDLARQGKAMMERAEAEAEAIVSQARIERDRLIAGASEKGFEDGRAAGFAQGLQEGRSAGHSEALEATRQEAQRVVKAWDDAVGAFDAAREAMLSTARDDIVRFAVAFAERVTRRAIELDPAAVEPTMADALGLVMGANSMRVCVCPADAELARQALGPVMQRLGLSGDATLFEDANLEHGSCVVQTQAGCIDASVDAMIARMVNLLLPDSRGMNTRGPDDASTTAGAPNEAPASDLPEPNHTAPNTNTNDGIAPEQPETGE